MPADQGGTTIMFAPWPKPLGADFHSAYSLDESDERFVDAKYELVTKARNLRREFNVSGAKKVRFILRSSDSRLSSRRSLPSDLFTKKSALGFMVLPKPDLPPYEAAVLKLLLNAETVEFNVDVKKGTPSVGTQLGDLFLPLEGLIDVAAEKARLNKELEKIAAEIVKVQDKLNNPSFTQKVPAAVLEEHQKRLADWQAKREAILRNQQLLEGE
jgi:valyl-tRNA synthetase